MKFRELFKNSVSSDDGAEIEEPTYLINGKAYLENDEINHFLEENGIKLNNAKTQSLVFNSVHVVSLDIHASIVKVTIDQTQLVELFDLFVPGSLSIGLIAKSKDVKNKQLTYFMSSGTTAEAVVNLNTVEEKDKPLKPGIYSVYIQIKYQNISSGIGETINIPLGTKVIDLIKQTVIETELYYFTGKLQIKNKVIYGVDLEHQTLQILDKQMLQINPGELYGDIKNKTENPGRLYTIFLHHGFPLLYQLIKFLPVKKNRIFFASDSREEMGGNFEFLNRELERQNFKDIHYVFNENQFVSKSMRTFLKFAFLAATSEFIFIEENHNMFESIKLKRKTTLIQTWHAAGAFKTFGYSRLGMPGGPKFDSRAHRYYNNVSVSSKAMVPIYAEAFDLDAEQVEPLGIARTDLFYDVELQKDRINQINEEYDFLKSGKKVILFAPTFRGGTRKSAHYPFEYLDFQKLYEKLHEEYVFLIKVHFNTLNKVTIPVQYADFLYDVSAYRDVNDLMLVSDIMITDYSSVAFEFALLNRPMLFFAFDLADYVSSRGFYFDYDSFVPGKIVTTTKTLVDAILQEDFESYKISKFRDYFFTYQDGQASKRIVDRFVNRQEEITK
ncbi:CDP-glycerol glycerophosphotransferase family protein [Leuconostoc sp. C2]|uniref:CDP-glycerol glycerophosphotransferase family protein n=1 Tax=Leuconostoc sp. (strain C2) TaxID=979982 RepID=UPI0002175A0F|nr:CDP-glycerol glycerophosphotransferase family protein [Leuconostoc sp. C2]AEJ30767.1 putative CDP-ribitol ribitolphosphotransferase [Leuconostoc sp. C2]